MMRAFRIRSFFARKSSDERQLVLCSKKGRTARIQANLLRMSEFSRRELAAFEEGLEAPIFYLDSMLDERLQDLSSDRCTAPTRESWPIR